MENRNSIAGSVPVNNLSKNILTNSQERPLSFTEGFDEHGAHYSELLLTSANKNNSDNASQAAAGRSSKLTMVTRNKKSTGGEQTPSISSSGKSGKHAKQGKKSNIKSVSDDSETELDRDVLSLNSQESRNSNQPTGIPTATHSSKSKRRLSGEWEILEGLKAGQSFTQNPGRYAGFMMKNRKWPMKGWHKRFFSLENGYLTYAKSANDIERGKYHGQVDVGLSVIVCKSRGHRIDMDADDTIYHLKTKTLNEFEEWKTHLRDHRLFRQNTISYGCNRDVNDIINMVAYTSTVPSPDTPTEDLPDGDLNNVFIKLGDTMVERSNEVLSPTSVGTETTTATFPKTPMNFAEQKAVLLFSEELNEIQLKLFDLGSLLSNIQEAQQAINNVPSAAAAAGKKDKSKKHAIGRSNKKEKRLKELLVVPDASPPLMKCSSNPSLVNEEDLATPPPQLMTHSPFLAPSTSAHEQFYRHAEYIHSRLKKLCNQMLATERTKASDPRHAGFGPQYVQSLKHTVTELKKQNAEYRSRLTRIHHESTLHDAMSSLQHPILTPTPSLHHREVKSPTELTLQAYPRRSLVSSESLDSQNNEFYDAPDQLDPSTEGSEEEEEEDEMSDSEMKLNPSLEPDLEERFSRFQMRRRSRLPSPSVESDISIWGLLRKNIGKDLSKISMPVGMNEPLNALQRLCEELEYSELLERAADIDDPYERMVWVAVFTVSSYSSTFTRAGYKPFNPLLGETYECDRPEKGWRFVAEQVSHHPPVSASYCESKDFTMWQDIQVKTKFWGKSMEVQPIGLVNLVLTRHKENYTWNKATSCIHNILGGQRWVEHYGEVILTNHKRGIICKLNYVKSSYFSAKKYEVYGQVCSVENETPVHHLFGRWNESMFHGQSESSAKCIWRPGALPPDHHLYYGFTKFAMELNEIDPDQVKLYPITDTRFRPDQRLLECGKIEEAESEKRSVEQKQREMRKLDEFSEGNYSPKWFTKRRDITEDKETYEYNGMYWNKRKNPGFSAMNLPQLW